MIVPKFWAEASTHHRKDKKSITVRRYGWSNTSLEEAEQNARQRAADALARIISGEKLDRREHKIAYNGAEGLPIREEVVNTFGEIVITRNSYGALCLNTPNVLFADIDFEDIFKPRFLTARVVLSMATAIALGFFLQSIAVGIVSGAITAGVLSIFARVIPRLSATLKGGAKHVAMEKVHLFCKSHPDWRIAAYETPGGLRLLALHKLFDPRDHATIEFFHALNVDSVYARMCLNQNCFRARLTPKPWRIGMQGHMRPRPGVWPINPQKLPLRQQWVDAYERASVGFAACRFIEEIGNGPVNDEAKQVRVIHDELSRARSDLKIA